MSPAHTTPGLRVAVLLKQVPRFEDITLGPDGRLRREGIELEINPYCRRAIAKGVELAQTTGGMCTAFTLGPPAADDSLREAVAWGADEAVHICDPAFAGSDTLATAGALSAALEQEGPFDIVLAGLASVDADTGQVGPEVAELLGVPFLTGVRELDVSDGKVRASCHHDDGWEQVATQLPAVISCAERLCAPAKVDPPGRAAVDPALIRRRSATDLGPGPWGAAGSPTTVGEIRTLEVRRQRVLLAGDVADQVAEAVDRLVDAGVVGRSASPALDGLPEPTVPDRSGRGTRTLVVTVEPGRPHETQMLLGAAAELAEAVDGSVEAFVTRDSSIPSAGAGDTVRLASWGSDEIVWLDGVVDADDVAPHLIERCKANTPWAVLAPSTAWGREVAARTAASISAGLTGDAVDLAVDYHGATAEPELIGWKPALGGTLVAAIRASSPTHLVTVRPGVLEVRAPRTTAAGGPLEAIPQQTIDATPRGRVTVVERHRDDDLDALANANVVVGVGTGVAPEEYPSLQPLLEALDAELAATRKVTDNGWQPRARQVGITGRAISPRLYVALGLAGKFTHVVGIRAAGTVLAINGDRDAPIFEHCDIGIVGDWHEVVPFFVKAVEAVDQR